MQQNNAGWITALEARRLLTDAHIATGLDPRRAQADAEAAIQRRIAGGRIGVKCERLIYENGRDRHEHDDVEPENFPSDLLADADRLSVSWDWVSGDLAWRYRTQATRGAVSAFGLTLAEADVNRMIPKTIPSSIPPTCEDGWSSNNRLRDSGDPDKLQAGRDHEERRVAAILDEKGFPKREVKKPLIATFWNRDVGDPSSPERVAMHMKGQRGGRPSAE